MSNQDIKLQQLCIILGFAIQIELLNNLASTWSRIDKSSSFYLHFHSSRHLLHHHRQHRPLAKGHLRWGSPPLPQSGHYPKEGVFLLGFLPQTLNIVFIMSTLTFHTISTFLSQILPRTAQTGLRNPLEPWSRAARKWKENEEMKSKWGENEEMERDSLSTFPHSIFTFSLSIHFLYQKMSHFVAKCYIWHF